MNKTRIDLHTHTSSSISNGDHRIDFESVEKSILLFKQYNVKIAAFSDHNTFNVEQYKKAHDLGNKMKILFLPAIEVNVKRKSDFSLANIIYVFDENLSDEELEKISNIAKKSIPKRGISNDDINNLFSEFETIKIPHIGKSDSFKIEDLKHVEIDAIEISNKKNSNYLRTLKKGYNGSIVAFSDTHIWKKYPELGDLITEIDDLDSISFMGLKNAFKKNKDYTKER